MFAETDREIKEAFAETARKFRETDKEIEKLAKLFTGQWGKLIEALVKPSSLKLFQERGIKVEEGADKFAYRQGLFVLAGSGEGMIKILNNLDFRPKNFENPSARI